MRLRTPALMVFALLPARAFPGGTPLPSSPEPPEVAKTVAAVRGTWTGTMTAEVPGAPPEAFPWTMRCAPEALGAGVACTMKGIASIGRLAQACLVAFDPVGRLVHYMCVTSMGEVHDHKGQWVDSSRVEFEPLQSGPMVETLLWRFPEASTIEMSSTVATGGVPMHFVFRGRRETP
jgi:hypothetical protein